MAVVVAEAQVYERRIGRRIPNAGRDPDTIHGGRVASGLGQDSGDDASNRAEVIVNKLLDALLKKYGTSNVMLKRSADLLWEHMNPEDPSDLASGMH